MDGPASVTDKRARSGSKTDADIIKIKRSKFPEDIAFAHHKEESVAKGDFAESESDMINEDDIQNAEGNKDDVLKGEGDEGTEIADESGKGHRLKNRVSHGYHLVEGKMRHGMEDYLVATNKKMDVHELGLYAIFDGHSGSQVAEYLQSHLFENILDQPDFWTDPKTAVKKVYDDANNDILENVVGARGGSTAVTAILIDGEKLVVANVGDSRAVICKDGRAEQITVDHEPLKEKELVESKGGFVAQKPGNVPRVDGQLAMTRAFGDEKVKDHITAEPDIVTEKIDDDSEFIILASDGLWKVMSNQEAVDCIQGLKNGQEAAEKLIEEALSRKSQDDISCVVVVFYE